MTCEVGTSSPQLLFMLHECEDVSTMNKAFIIETAFFAAETLVLMSYMAYLFIKNRKEPAIIFVFASIISFFQMLTTLGYYLNWVPAITAFTYFMFCVGGILCVSRVCALWSVTHLRIIQKDTKLDVDEVIQDIEFRFKVFNIFWSIPMAILWIVAHASYDYDSTIFNRLIAAGLGWLAICVLIITAMIVLVGRDMKRLLTAGVHNQQVLNNRTDHTPEFLALLKKVSIYTRVQASLFTGGFLALMAQCLITLSLGYMPRYFWVCMCMINPMVFMIPIVILSFFIFKYTHNPQSSNPRFDSVMSCLCGFPDTRVSVSDSSAPTHTIDVHLQKV